MDAFLDLHIRRAACHLVVQSFFHQPLRSIKFCVLSTHVCEDALLHVRSFLVVQLDALGVPFVSFGHAEAQGCEAQGRESKMFSTDEIRLAKIWYEEYGMDLSEIAELLR